MLETREEMRQEAKDAIIDALSEGYDGYLCDLMQEVFNTDVYEPYTDRAIEQLDALGGYSVVNECIQYEQDNFGEVSERYDEPCWVLGMLWYIVGEEVLADLMDGVDEADEWWNEELTEDRAETLVKAFENKEI